MHCKPYRVVQITVAGVCLCVALDQEGTIVAAEGIDKCGKGVLQMTFVFLSETGPRALDSQEDAALTPLRIPVDAVEMTGFSRADNDMVGLLMKACAQRVA